MHKKSKLIDFYNNYRDTIENKENASLVMTKNSYGFYSLTGRAIAATLINEYDFKRLYRKRPKNEEVLTAVTSLSPIAKAISDRRKINKELLGRIDPNNPSSIRCFPIWRDLSAEETVYIFQRSLDMDERGYPVTLRVSEKLCKLFNSDPNTFLDTMHRRLRNHLKSVYDMNIDYWFVLEVDEDGCPHLHGTVDVNGNGLPYIKEALLKVTGITDKSFKRYAFHIGNFKKHEKGGAGWVEYCVKHLKSTKDKFVLSTAITVTQSMTNNARKFYESEHELANEIIKGTKKYYQTLPLPVGKAAAPASVGIAVAPKPVMKPKLLPDIPHPKIGSEVLVW